MEVVFYYNMSDTRAINKTLIPDLGQVFKGELREDVNVMNPVIRFESSDILRYNYAYVPELQRYYEIESIDIVREGIYDVSFTVDVLMSFRGHILQLTAIVDKQTMGENGDEYIDDGSLVMDNVMFTQTYNFPDGFNDTPEYILITAG